MKRRSRKIKLIMALVRADFSGLVLSPCPKEDLGEDNRAIQFPATDMLKNMTHFDHILLVNINVIYIYLIHMLLV